MSDKQIIMKNEHDGRSSQGRDNIARLKNVAFWLWQYQSRNPHYVSYSNAICAYIDYFMKIGELEFITSIDITTVAMLSDSEAGSAGLCNMPIVEYFFDKHGNDAKKTIIKFHYLCRSFYKKFGRHAKFAFDRINTSAQLEALLSGNHMTFETEDPGDIASVLNFHYDWNIKSSKGAPNSGISILNKSNETTISGDSLFADDDILGLEVDSIKLFFKAAESFWSKTELDDKILRSVYKLCISGDRVKNTDIWRLCALWMWDKAHEKDFHSPIDFDTVYKLLKDKVENAYLEDGVWDQILTRKNRVRKCYEGTARCIKEMTILPLQL